MGGKPLNVNVRTILYVHSSNEMYGADLILLQLVERLNREHFRPIIALPTDIPYQGLLREALHKRNIKTIHLNLAILRRKYFTMTGVILYAWRFIKSTFSIIQLIRSERVDIVHSNTIAVIPGALAAFLTHTAHIWHVHEIIVHPRFLWRLTSWLMPRLSTKVVTVSEQTREHIIAGNRQNAEKAVVLYNGIDLSRFMVNDGRGQKVRREWGIETSQTLVGMVGRISEWKGQDYFLQIAQLISKSYPSVRFAMVGGTFPGQEHLLADLKEKIMRFQLTDLVMLSDFRLDIPAVLDAYDIFVLPSTLPDPFPTVILEAMAAGKPIVANAHGGSVEMIEHQVTGLLVKPGQKDEMVSAIEYMINNPFESKEMGRRGRERMREKFSLDAFITNWINLYDTITTG